MGRACMICMQPVCLIRTRMEFIRLTSALSGRVSCINDKCREGSSSSSSRRRKVHELVNPLREPTHVLSSSPD